MGGGLQVVELINFILSFVLIVDYTHNLYNGKCRRDFEMQQIGNDSNIASKLDDPQITIEYLKNHNLIHY